MTRAARAGLERPVAVEQAAQVGAVDQVHGHEQQAVLLAGVVDRDHVRVADRDRDPRLLAEARGGSARPAASSGEITFSATTWSSAMWVAL